MQLFVIFLTYYVGYLSNVPSFLAVWGMGLLHDDQGTAAKILPQIEFAGSIWDFFSRVESNHMHFRVLTQVQTFV